MEERCSAAATPTPLASCEGAAVFVCGSNDHGSLCLPSPAPAPGPVRGLALRSHFVRCIAAGNGWSACGTGGDAVFAWASGHHLVLPRMAVFSGRDSHGFTNQTCPNFLPPLLKCRGWGKMQAVT